MTTKRLAQRIIPLSRLLALCAGLVFAASVQAVEPVPATSSMPPSESASPLSRLQNFTTHAADLAINAIAMIGIRYQRGGTDPENGLDCSGLVRYVFKEAWNKDLPRTSKEMSQMGKKIDPHELQPGDLVFYNTMRRGFSHVGIYLGDSRFVHSPAAGAEVRIESMDLSYWKKRFNGARRITDTSSQ